MSESLNLIFQEAREQLLNFHNELRTDPQSFIPHLEKHKSMIKDGILRLPRQTPIKLKEGVEAYDNAIDYLKSREPVGTLIMDDTLCKAAKGHAKEIGGKGLMTHDSVNGMNVSDRIEQYTEWEGACGENIDFGTKNPLEILLYLLVDDGIRTKPHRNLLFNEKFNYIGIGFAEHKEYEVVVVIDYVGNVRPVGTPFFDLKNLKYQYPQETEKKEEKKPVNAFQAEDRDAPDDTISVRMVKTTKMVDDKECKVTKKFYTLKDGSTHIVEVEDI